MHSGAHTHPNRHPRPQDDGALQPGSASKRPRGILGARFLVTQQHDENSRGGGLLRGGLHVDRYGRLEEEQ